MKSEYVGTAVMTDHPWSDIGLEQDILREAGLELVAGPEKAGSREDIEGLIRRANPVAILTCWAEVSALALSIPSELKIVARMGVGLDNIAVDAATAQNCWVTNVPDYCVSEVSDHAVGLLLAHFRGICRLDAATKKNGWVSDGAGLERIADLTVGIIGYGRIGQETARKLKSFGCRILSHSRQKKLNDDYATPGDLAEIQAESNVIIIHAPLTADTEGLLDESFLMKCRKRPLLINVSRGGVVKNDALLNALNNGQLCGAALDVVDGEPFPPESLLQRSDVIVTPHVAYASAASLIELRRRACEEVVRAIKGEKLHHPCNMVVGYE